MLAFDNCRVTRVLQRLERRRVTARSKRMGSVRRRHRRVVSAPLRCAKNQVLRQTCRAADHTSMSILLQHRHRTPARQRYGDTLNDSARIFCVARSGVSQMTIIII